MIHNNMSKQIEEENKRFQMMLMESPLAFCILTGKDLVIKLANGLMKEFWGKGNDIEGKPLLEILPELRDQPFPEMILSVLKTGIPVYANEILTHLIQNGKREVLYFNVIYQPNYEFDNTISGVTTIAYDVTETVTARKKVEESESHFRQMADLMPAKISNADAEGNVTYFNQKWLEYTGMSFEELRDFGYHKIIHPDELVEFQNRFQQASETGTVLKMEMRFLNKEGNYKWHLNLASPIIDSEGKITMWIGSTTEMHDQMSQKAELEVAVRRRTIELEKSNQLLASQKIDKEERAAELLIANKELLFQNKEKEKRAVELLNANEELLAFNHLSSHDLQEPLRKLQMFTGIILDKENDNLSEDGKSIFKRMRVATDKMRQLIDGLVVFSEISYFDRPFDKISIASTVSEIKIELHDDILKKKATITVVETNSCNAIPFQLKQLLVNMIGNSLKFSKPDVPLSIVIESKDAKGSEIDHLNPQTNYCHIIFSDDGNGFDPKYNNHVFEVFKQYHGGAFTGAGIGLSIVKKIVENHNGFITATGAINEGAKFDIYIPQVEAL